MTSEASDLKRGRWLEARGYVLLSSFYWTHPTRSNPTPEEWEAIDYLIDEWDYGGFIEFAQLNPPMDLTNAEWEALNEQVKQQHDQANETTDGPHA